MPDDYELDDELKTFVEDRLGVPFDQDTPTEAPVPDVEEVPAPDIAEPDETPEVEPEAEPDDTTVTLPNGAVLTRDEALSYAQFDALLRNDPALFRTITEAIQGRAASAPGAPTQAPTSTPQAPALPEFNEDEYTDPAVKSLYETAKAQREYIAQMDARLNQVHSLTIAQQQEELQSLLNSTRGDFATKHNLTKAEMDKIQGTAERLNVIPSLMRGIDPITGTVAPRNRSSAITRAFDIAYNFIPEFRERSIAEAVKERAKSTQRKQRLAGVGGSSGGVPKNEPMPTTDTERRAAMIREVAEAMGEHRPE